MFVPSGLGCEGVVVGDPKQRKAITVMIPSPAVRAIASMAVFEDAVCSSDLVSAARVVCVTNDNPRQTSPIAFGIERIIVLGIELMESVIFSLFVGSRPILYVINDLKSRLFDCFRRDGVGTCRLKADVLRSP